MTRRDPIRKKRLGVQLELSSVGIVGLLSQRVDWPTRHSQAVTGQS